MEHEHLSPRVVIAHPGRQHSHQAALALAKARMLGGYWAGVPALERQKSLFRWFSPRLVLYEDVDLPSHVVRCLPWFPILRRLGSWLATERIADRAAHLGLTIFDYAVASHLKSGDFDAVMAYENSALLTFRAARGLGLVTILDAASVHHTTQDRLHAFTESVGRHRTITARKDAEIDLADHILTASEFARQTYLCAGVSEERLHAMPLGVDLELFAPGQTDAERQRREFTFVFAGAMIARKGFDRLVEAFRHVQREVPKARLLVAGSEGDATHVARQLPASSVTFAGAVSQRELAGLLRRSDCLVLHSRCDSYAMVVPEALACGLPVIVSEMVGAKELVQTGKNGWILPLKDDTELFNRMLWCVRNPEVVRAMRTVCRASAARVGWDSYHRRLAELVGRLVPPRSA